MNRYTEEEIKSFCQQSYSYAEVLRKMSLTMSGNNYRKLKNRIAKYNIDVAHFTDQLWYKTPGKQSNLCGPKKEKYDLNEVFCNNSKVTQKVLRDYTKRHNVIPYICVKCNNDGSWLNEPLSLELDHIDGDEHNNSIENLRYLCPNCHAQTKTFRGKNKALKIQKRTSTV